MSVLTTTSSWSTLNVTVELIEVDGLVSTVNYEVYAMERWRAIDGFDGYEVSDQGRVRSVKFSKPRYLMCVDGGTCVNLRRDKRSVRVSVMRLVSSAFLRGWSPDKWVYHLDGDRGNNAADNLAITNQYKPHR